MIGTDRYTYVQMQKTASGCIEAILRAVTGARRQGRKHTYFQEKPARLVFGSVRDPWAWYVSLWAFRGRGVNPIAPALYKDDPRYGKYFASPYDIDLFREWMAVIHDPANAGDLHGGYGDFPLIDSVGFMTWRYAYLYMEGIGFHTSPEIDDLGVYDRRHNMVDYWIHTESIAFDVLAALAGAGYTLSPAQQAEVERLARIKRNASVHGDYRHYYDTATHDLVRERDSLIIGKHYGGRG